jgi:S-adenosylmethionine synthetase
VIAAGWPAFCPSLPARFVVNGAGNFAVGGPEGDNGLSGKKLVVDAYGPRVPIGGGALSGKDFYKADRAGASLARRLAKAVVLTGAAPECRVTLAIFPGDQVFRIVSLQTPNGCLNPSRWESIFDLSLAAAGDLYAGAADPVMLARYGHFSSSEAPWERLRM